MFLVGIPELLKLVVTIFNNEKRTELLDLIHDLKTVPLYDKVLDTIACVGIWCNISNIIYKELGGGASKGLKAHNYTVITVTVAIAIFSPATVSWSIRKKYGNVVSGAEALR